MTPDARLAAALAAPLQADPALVLAKAAPDAGHPLDELVARPLLNLHAPELAAVRSPLAPAWAVRAEALRPLALAPGAALDLLVLVDLWRAYGLTALAEVDLELELARDEPIAPQDAGALVYVLAALLHRRAAPGPASTAYRSAEGTLRVDLTETRWAPRSRA